MDDERLFAEAIELILAADGRIEVVGRALDGNEAIALARATKPDVVLMDISMPGLDGFAAIEQLVGECDGLQVLVLSGSADQADIARAEAAGACGYLTKENIADDLVPKVLAAAR